MKYTDPDGRDRLAKWLLKDPNYQGSTLGALLGPGWGPQLKGVWDGFSNSAGFRALLLIAAARRPQQGARGEALSRQAATARGEIIRGTQVTVESESGVRTRVDVVTQTPTGNIKLIESKNGPNARLTPNQQQAFPEIEQTGTCTPCGNNARKAGLAPGKKLENVQVQVDHHNQKEHQ